MRIIWIRNMKKTEPPATPDNDEVSFQEHDERMKQFSFSHPPLNLPEPDDIITDEQTLLVPIQGVKLAKHSQN